MLQFIIDLMLICFYGFLTISVFAYVRRFWGLYVAQQFINKTQDDTIMLEIKLPREIDKSPLAMEMILPYFIQGGGLSWYNKGIKGVTPTAFSLEIASLEGVIHFYVRCHKKFKELITSAFYAHYPGVEIIQAEDYTTQFPRYEHNKSDVSMWGNGFKLNKKHTLAIGDKEKSKVFWFDKLFHLAKQEDQDGKKDELNCDMYPIRTYLDLELDKQKEEFKVDPLVSVLEFFGSLGKGEYAGLQILLQDPSVYDGKKQPKIYHSEVDHKTYSANDIAGLEIKRLRTKATHEAGKKVEDAYGNPVMEKGDEKTQLTYKKEKIEMYSSVELPPENKASIEAIQAKMAKPMLACVMRVIYVTDNKKTKFNGGHVQNCLNLTKPFNAPGYNTIGLNIKELANPYDYDWQNPNSVRSNWRAEEIFDAYIEREGFHPHLGLVDWFSGSDADSIFFNMKGYIRRTVTIFAEAVLDPFGHPHPDGVFHLNTEELATIFHLPGLVASVPTLPRIDSRKSVAPVNLPQ